MYDALKSCPLNPAHLAAKDFLTSKKQCVCVCVGGGGMLIILAPGEILSSYVGSQEIEEQEQVLVNEARSTQCTRVLVLVLCQCSQFLLLQPQQYQYHHQIEQSELPCRPRSFSITYVLLLAQQMTRIYDILGVQLYICNLWFMGYYYYYYIIIIVVNKC